MKKVLHIIPTLKFGGISSVVSSWHNSCHGVVYNFDYVSFNDGPLNEKFTNEGSNVFVIPTLRKNIFSYFYQLNKIIMQGKYDVIHVHNSFKNGFVLLIAALYGVKYRACHSHTSGLEDKRLNFYLPFLKWMIINFSNVRLACGKEAGYFLYGDKKHSIISNTIDIKRITNVTTSKKDLKAKYNIPYGKTVVGHVGRFSDVKNHNFIVDLAYKTSEKYHFILVGNGPKKKEIFKKIETKGLANRFTFIEPTPEIPELLSLFDVFMFPSKFEGVSLALLEAQAAALNCLVSNSVPSDNDVGLGLISFLPLDSVDVWLDKLGKLELNCLSKEEITERFNLCNFTNESLYKQLKFMYD